MTIDPQDAAQDAALRLLRKNINPLQHPALWTQVQRQCQIDLYRAERSRRPERNHEKPAACRAPNAHDSAEATDPRMQAERMEYIRFMWAAIDSLPVSFRQVLRCWEQPAVEVARQLNVPIPTVRTRRRRGRQMLLEKLRTASNPSASHFAETVL